MIRSFTDSVAHILADISTRREAIKEDYMKAWIATFVEDKDLTPEWLASNVYLEERWSDDRLTVSWRMVRRTEAT